MGTLTGNRVRMCRVDRRTWNKTNPFTYTDIYFTFFFLILGCQEVRIEYTLYACPINVHHKLLLFLKHWVAMELGSNTHCLHAQWMYITSRAATPKGRCKRCMAQPGLPLIKKTFAQRYFQFTNSHHHHMHKSVEEVNENTQTAVNSHSSIPPTPPPPPPFPLDPIFQTGIMNRCTKSLATENKDTGKRKWSP